MKVFKTQKLFSIFFYFHPSGLCTGRGRKNRRKKRGNFCKKKTRGFLRYCQTIVVVSVISNSNFIPNTFGERKAIECIWWPKKPLWTVFEPFQVPSNAGLAPFPANKGVQNGRSGECPDHTKSRWPMSTYFYPHIPKHKSTPTSQFAL